MQLGDKSVPTDATYIFLCIFATSCENKLFCVRQRNHLFKVSIMAGFTLHSIHCFTSSVQVHNPALAQIQRLSEKQLVPQLPKLFILTS